MTELKLTERELRALHEMAGYALQDEAFDIEEWFAGKFTRKDAETALGALTAAIHLATATRRAEAQRFLKSRFKAEPYFIEPEPKPDPLDHALDMDHFNHPEDGSKT